MERIHASSSSAARRSTREERILRFLEENDRPVPGLREGAMRRVDDGTPGLFLAAVGADAPDKQELDPEILRAGRLVVDSREPCATIGELHHALEQGVIESSAAAAGLAEVVAGTKPGRRSRSEIAVFDSTGVAIEDVAAAAAADEEALRTDRGQAWDL